MKSTNILIVGGGLAGLSLARQLQAAKVDYHLVEARSRWGGRIVTQLLHHPEQNHPEQTGYFDLGPAWFWPGQPRIEALVKELGLTTFLQYAAGDQMVEMGAGRVVRGGGYASMAGSLRLKGGWVELVNGITSGLETARLSLGWTVTAIETDAEESFTPLSVTCVNSEGFSESLTCQRIVLALPPRVVAERIAFSPALPVSAISAMKGIATWMAGHAKIVAVYERPFWREAGLSGDAMSRFGPMAEIHDASPEAGGPYALFGFVSVPAMTRQQDIASLKQNALEQLSRLFGSEALHPIQLMFQDWAYEPETSTELDFQPLYAHPAYGLPHALSHLWQGRLLLSSTEVAPNFGGYLEGALEAAETAFHLLL